MLQSNLYHQTADGITIAYTGQHYGKCLKVAAKIIRLLQIIYSNSSSCVCIHSELSDEFSVQSGVQHGCVFSPLLFNAVINSIMKKIFQGRPGVQFRDVEFITDLMFTDDSAVLAKNNAGATDILYDITSTAKPDGLTINIDKTEVMTMAGSLVAVYLNSIQIEQVTKFKYLSLIVQEKTVKSTAEVYSRIGLVLTTSNGAYGGRIMSWSKQKF